MTHRRRPVTSFTALALIAATLTATPAVSAASVVSTAAAELPPSSELALSDQTKQDLILDVVERFVPHAESYRQPSDLAEPRTEYYKADGPGVTQPRGAGNIALAYATLLTGRPDQPSFGGVPRAELLDHTVQSIRHEALTSRLSGAGYNRWGRGEWQSALETYGWGWAAYLLWEHLDADTRTLVQRVVTGEADILITKPPATAVDGNTGAEDNGWNAPAPTLAAVMFPEHPNRAAWEQAAIRHAINASTIAADEQSSGLIDGRPLSEWAQTVNVNPDLTIENHGFYNPIYQQVTHLNLGEAAAIYGSGGHAVPEAFSFRTEEMWDQVLAPLAADDGDLVMPAGQDWTSKDYQHLAYLSVLATRFGRADASVAESRALQLVATRQQTHDDGSILGQPLLGYESMLIKRLSAAWWNHELFGPSPQPTQTEYDAERATTAGVRHFETVDVVQARQRDAFTSMSWSSQRPMGLVVPAAGGHGDDPIFAAYPPGGLVGSATGPVSSYTCDCDDDQFSTAGRIGTRSFSMTSFADGTVLLLDRGEGSTFTIALERIAGFVPDRPIYSADGEGIGSLSGSWVNADDRLGMAVAGGGDIRVRDVGGANPYRLLEGSATTGSGNRGAALYPLADRSTTEALAAELVQPPAPDGWSGLLAGAADGTRRFAVARWAGDPTTTFSLSDPRGGPVTSWPSVVSGTTATASATLDAPASRGDVVRWFVDSSGPVQTRLSGDRPVLTNDGADPVTVVATYVADDGTEQTVERELFPGEQVTARVVDGAPSLAGAEHEPLRSANAVLAELAGQVERWRADGTLRPAEASALASRVAKVDEFTGQALQHTRATSPDTRRLDVLIQAARGSAAELQATGPDVVRDRVGADRQAVTAALDAALDAFGPAVRFTSVGTARPGEPLRVTATVVHRGRPGISEGVLRLSAPPGWTASPAQSRVRVLLPSDGVSAAFQLAVPPDAAPGSTVGLEAAFDYRWGSARETATASAEVTVSPLLGLAPADAELPLAVGGWNEAEVEVTNWGSAPHTVELTAAAPDGVQADPAVQSVTLAPGQRSTVTVALRNTAVAAGAGALSLVARTAGSSTVETTSTVGLRFSTNLALNAVGARWPAPVADSHQAAFPPALAVDGDPATFWVSAGTASGQGPTPQRPIAYGVDFGAPVEIGAVAMTPRPNFGPRAYTVEVSTDGASWTPVASVASAPASGTVTSALPTPVTARHLRLVMTSSWDRIQPPRNVQIAELTVTAPTP